MNRLRQAALAVALAATFNTAQALNTASAELTAIRVQVVDLTPDDGIAAALILPSSMAGYHVVASTLGLNLTTGELLFVDDQSAFFLHASLPFRDARLFSGTPATHATVERGADRLFASVTASTSTLASARSSWSSGLTGPVAHDDELMTGAFQLAPGTALVLSADYRQSVNFEAGQQGASASWVSLFGAMGTVAADDVLHDGHGESSSVLGHRTSQGSLSLTLSNNSSQTMPVYFGAMADASSMATPVPEPGSLALLLAGGLAVGLRSRAGRRNP